MELDKPNIDINWHRTKLPKETLAKLNERSDWRGGLQAGGFLALILATGASSVYFWHVQAWWLFGICLFLHGTVTSFCINAVHELVHGTVFRTKWLNRVFTNIFGFIGVINPHMFWYSHTEHHKYTLHPPDDLEVIVPVYHSTGRYFTTFLVNFYFYREFSDLLRFCFGKFKGEWEPVIVPEHSPSRRKKVIGWSRAVILLHLLIIVVSIWSGWWIIPIVTTFSGAYGAWLFYLCNFTQHAGLTENINDFRLNCRTIYINPISRFLYWHMNWHIEHHMYAAVPCYNLRKLHYAIKHELPHCPKGLIETWVEIAYIQYRRLRDDDYRFIAELPGEDGKFSSTKSRLQQIREQADARLGNSARPNSSGRRWECSVCGFIYDEARGLPEEGIAPGTAWDDIPDDWRCPDCGVSKAEFDMVEISPDREVSAETMDLDAMARKKDSILIVGSGLAGYGLAREIRKQDKTRAIHLITRDDGRAYSKPMLSNAFAQNKTAEDLASASAEEMAKKLNISVHAHCQVRSIDRDARHVTTDQGEFPYGDLVLALGADPIRLPIQGEGASSVLSVNDLADYEKFREALPGRRRIVILGAGLIGCEFANDLAQAGHDVAVLDIAPQLLNRLIPLEMSQALQALLERLDVSVHLETSLESVSEDLTCQLSNGENIAADVVLSAVGLRPRTTLAESAGLRTDRGIVVDNLLKTKAPNIHAIGDCAEVDGKLLPFIAPITIGIHALAKTLTGSPTKVEYPVMPVVVKTPAYPMVVAPPETRVEGDWQIEETKNGLIARFVDRSGQTAGFALGGSACSQESELVEEMNSTKSAPIPA